MGFVKGECYNIYDFIKLYDIHHIIEGGYFSTISFTLLLDFVISTHEEDDKNHLFISGNNHSAWPE